MLKRKIDRELNEWKNNWNNKACLINGARQVGKTFSVREFGKENYDAVYELNFLENVQLKDIFAGSLDSETILSNIRLHFPEVKFVKASTLLFFDEIQECPEAITALKFLCSQESFDVIATGSALGISYKSTSSFPVGCIHNIQMHALSFEEFLWAKGVESDLLDGLAKHYKLRTPVPVSFHNKMLEYLREYMVVGGMPAVVQNYVYNHDILQVHTLQRNILSDYINDIARFSHPQIKIKAENCYRSIPFQLQKENHKFQYSKVEKKGTARKFETSVDWLINAHLAKCVFNVSKIEYPLANFKKEDNFRLYMNDIGLFLANFDFSVKQSLLQDLLIDEPLDNNLILRTAKGGIYEALAADILLKNGHEDLYFFRNNQGDIEIDFLIENEFGCVPLEIKAGAKTKTKSLNRVLESDSIAVGYKFGSQNVGVLGKKITMPLYMLMFV